MKSHIEETCKVTCTNNDKVAEAEVMSFSPKNNLIVALATNKIHMKWNGSVYVGSAFGYEFTTHGPIEHVTKQGRGL